MSNGAVHCVVKPLNLWHAHKTKGKVDGNYSAEEEEVSDLVMEEEDDISQFYLKSLALVIC